jgi:hypothetical protein
MVSVPVRAAPAFAATVMVTAPCPVPVAPDTTVIQVAALTAVHEQPAGAVRLTVTDPPAASTPWAGRSSENTQSGAATAAWLMVNV